MSRISTVLCSLAVLAWVNVFVVSDSSAAPRADLDNDGVLDGVDNCPANPNGHQEDTDADGDGDVCDRDTINAILESTLKGKSTDAFHASTPFYRMRFGGDAAIAFSAEDGMFSTSNAGIGMPGANDGGVMVLTPQGVPAGLVKGYKRNGNPTVVQSTWQTALAEDLYTAQKKPPVRLHTGTSANGAGLGFEIPLAQVTDGSDVEIDLALVLPSGRCLDTSEADAGAGVGRLTITNCAGGETIRIGAVGLAALGMETTLEDGPDFFGIQRVTEELDASKLEASVGPPGLVGSNFGGGNEAARVQQSHTLMENQADSALGHIRVTQIDASRYVLTLIAKDSFIARNRNTSDLLVIGIVTSSLTPVDLGSGQIVSGRHEVVFDEEVALIAQDVTIQFKNSLGTFDRKPVDYALWVNDGGTAKARNAGDQSTTSLACAGCTMTFRGSSEIHFDGAAGVGVGPGSPVAPAHPCLTSDPIDFTTATGRCAEGLGIRASFDAETLLIRGSMSGIVASESDIDVEDFTFYWGGDPNVTDAVALEGVNALGCTGDAGVRISINPADREILANVPVVVPDGCTADDVGMGVDGCRPIPLSSTHATGICNLVARRVTAHGPASLTNPEGTDLTLPAGVGLACGSRGVCQLGPKSFNAATGACEAPGKGAPEPSLFDGFYVALAVGGPANVDSISGRPLAFDASQAVPPARHCYDKFHANDNEVGITVGPNTYVEFSRCSVQNTQFGALQVANGLANAATVANTTAAGTPCPSLDGVNCRTPVDELSCPECKQGGKSFLAVSGAGISASTTIKVKQCDLGVDERGDPSTGLNPALPPLNVGPDLKAIGEPDGLTIAGRVASLGKAPIQVGQGPDNLLHPLVTLDISASNVAVQTVSVALDNRDSTNADQSGIHANDVCYSEGGGVCASGEPLVATAESDPEAAALDATAASLASSVEKPAGGDVQGPFKCYSSEPKGTPPDPIPVTVTDLFTGAVVNVDVLRPFDLCTPVNKDREGVPDPVSNLECYEIQGDDPPNVNVTVSTQFGTYDLGLINAKTLCVPAVTERGGGTLPEAQEVLSQFICYLTSSDAGAEVEALLEDDFEAKQTRVKGAPFMVCNAAAQTGEPNDIPEDHLACYQLSDAQGEPQFPGDVENVTDQFNPTGADLDIVRSRLLCERAKVVLRP
jgi:hypothetical protein